MKEPNPYAPSGVGAIASGTLPFPFDWKRFVKAFVVSMVAIVLWSGAVIAIQTTYALRAFSVEARVGGIVAVTALREVGAGTVMQAASLALFFTVAQQPAPSGSRITMSQLLPFLFALPIAAPVASCLLILAAYYVVSLAFDAPFDVFWTSIVEFTLPKDALLCVLKACLTAPVLVVVAPLAFRFTFAKPRRLRVKIAAAFLALMTVNTLASYLWRIVLEAFILGPVG